jgi:hypothetical protein
MAAEDIKAHRFTAENQPAERRSRKGVPNRATALRRWLAVKRELAARSNPSGKAAKGTVEDEIALALIGKALKGDVAAVREIYDTVYGKLTDKTELTGSADAPLRVTVEYVGDSNEPHD